MFSTAVGGQENAKNSETCKIRYYNIDCLSILSDNTGLATPNSVLFVVVPEYIYAMYFVFDTQQWQEPAGYNVALNNV